MIKLSAGLSKKLPLEGVEFSSHSASASIEVELADGTSSEQIKDELRNLYGLLEEAIDEQLGRKVEVSGPEEKPVAMTGRNGRRATEAQQRAIRAIAGDRGLSLRELQQMLQEQFGTENMPDLSLHDASVLIDILKNLERKDNGARNRK